MTAAESQGSDSPFITRDMGVDTFRRAVESARAKTSTQSRYQVAVSLQVAESVLTALDARESELIVAEERRRVAERVHELLTCGCKPGQSMDEMHPGEQHSVGLTGSGLGVTDILIELGGIR